MSNEKDFIPDPNAALFGSFVAIQAAVRALLQTHPNPLHLVAQLHNEKESSLAFLLNSNGSETMVEAFESTMDTLMPERDPG